MALSFLITVQMRNYWSIILSCFCQFWMFLNCQLPVNREKLYSIIFSSWGCQLGSVLSSLRDAVLLLWAISFESCFLCSTITNKRLLNSVFLINFWVLFPHNHPLLPCPSGHSCELMTILLYILITMTEKSQCELCEFASFFFFFLLIFPEFCHIYIIWALI